MRAGRGLTGSRVVTGLVGLLAASAVAMGVDSVLALRAEHRESAGREAAAAAATSQVTGLISVSRRTTAAEIDRLKAGATADFAAELAEQSTALRRALQSRKITSTGSVASAGVVAWSPAKARVLVAAVGKVATGSPQSTTPRAYRLQVDLRRIDERWLVSDMEFVS